MSERREPFVAWMYNACEEWDVDGEGVIYEGDTDPHDRPNEWGPVVVTPLLPDDPRPGETWLWDGLRVEVVTAPYRNPFGHPVVVVLLGHRNHMVFVSQLTRVPPEKTYRLKGGAFIDDGDLHVRAPSKEAALAKLAEALEEVEP